MRIINKIKRFLRLYLLLDKQQRAVSRWFAHKGDTTLRLNYQLDKNSVVFDLGGYKGDFAYKIYNRYHCMIYVFEPVKKFYEEIKIRFANNEKVKVFNFGLSNTNQMMPINLDDDATSVYAGDTKNKEEIELRDIDAFLNAEKISHIDLLKINIEGGEFDVLPRLIENNWITKIDNLQIQFHIFVKDAIKKRNQIRQAFRKTHSLTYDFYFIWENWQRKS